MKLHGSTCLDGPITKSRDWWHKNDDASATPETRQQPPTDEIRLDLVERVRGEIAAGIYETEDKLEIALAKLFQAIDLE